MRSRRGACRCCSTTGARRAPGVKFKDAELIGVPTIVVVGRGLPDGTIELKDRRSGERRNLAVDSAVTEILAEIGRS